MNEPYPQPTQEELDAPTTRLIRFNPYWWKIVQGKLGEIAWPSLWEDYTVEIDQALQHIFIGDVPTVNFEGCRTYRTTPLTLPLGVVTEIPMDGHFYDTLGCFVNGNSYFTIPKTGYYQISLSAQFGEENITALLSLYATKPGVYSEYIEVERTNGVSETRKCFTQMTFEAGFQIYFHAYVGGDYSSSLEGLFQRTYATIQFLGT